MSHRLAWVLAAVSLLAQEGDPVQWSFSKPSLSGRAKAGGVIRARLKAEIREGWHLYSLKKLAGGPIPTRITVPEGQPFSLAGEIDASAPEVVQDPVFDMEVEYYSDSAEFVVPVRIAADAKGDLTLKISARFQTCSDKICLPPRVAVVETTVTIAP